MTEVERICIYCLRRDVQFNKAHLFPECIGGRLWYEDCCVDCNSALGRTVEAKIKGHPFFAFGIDKLGIQPPDKAYKNIRITDQEAGERMKYVDGKLQGTSKKRDSGLRIGPRKELNKRAIEDVGKRFPNWVDFYRNELERGAKSIRLPGEVHNFSWEHKFGPAEFCGTSEFPIDVLAKLAYEGMWLAGLFTQDSLTEFRRSTFDVMPDSDGHITITVSARFRQRVRTLNPALWRTPPDYSKLVYRPFHRLDLRVTHNGTAYVRISFFGLCQFVVLVSQVEAEKIMHTDWLNCGIFFPIEGPKLAYGEYPESILPSVQGENVFADKVWDLVRQEFEQ